MNVLYLATRVTIFLYLIFILRHFKMIYLFYNLFHVSYMYNFIYFIPQTEVLRPLFESFRNEVVQGLVCLYIYGHPSYSKRLA